MAITSAYMYGNTTNHTQIFKIVKENIFPHTICVYENCWENIFFRPEEAIFENWQKLVSSNKIDLVHEKITYYKTSRFGQNVSCYEITNASIMYYNSTEFH